MASVTRIIQRSLHASARAAAGSQPLRVGFIGSGAVNFGGAEGPWDHASRLEQLQGSYPMQVVGIADPDVNKAQAVLERRAGEEAHASLYDGCNIFGDYKEMLGKASPDVVFLGVPPVVHGCFSSPVELDCVQAGASVFVEKPVSMAEPEEVLAYAEKVEQEAAANNAIVSVGYMFRYAKAVDALRELVATRGNGRIMAVLARYNCAYAAIDHPFWWDERQSGGPVVEQGTHFVDLARYVGGDIDFDTLQGSTLASTNAMGELSSIPGVVDEASIPVEKRLPRVTSAVWQFKSGTIGTLTHGLTMQGEKYDVEFTVWCDGLRVTLEEIYDENSTRLRVRDNRSDDDYVLSFSGDDCYLSEDEAFLKAVTEGGDSKKLVRSSFLDGAKTYASTVAIREAARGKASS